MTELQFPGGSVQIDEGLIWRALQEWLLKHPDGHARQDWHAREGGYWTAEVWDGNATHLGTSKLGITDAVAQALQIAAMAT